jgi:hypothetical protein
MVRGVAWRRKQKQAFASATALRAGCCTLLCVYAGTLPLPLFSPVGIFHVPLHLFPASFAHSPLFSPVAASHLFTHSLPLALPLSLLNSSLHAVSFFFLHSSFSSDRHGASPTEHRRQTGRRRGVARKTSENSLSWRGCCGRSAERRAKIKQNSAPGIKTTAQAKASALSTPMTASARTAAYLYRTLCLSHLARQTYCALAQHFCAARLAAENGAGIEVHCANQRRVA